MNIKQINFARKHAAYCNYYRNFAASKTKGVLQKPVSPWITYPGLAAAGYGAYKAAPYLAEAAAGWAKTDSPFPRTTVGPFINPNPTLSTPATRLMDPTTVYPTGGETPAGWHAPMSLPQGAVANPGEDFLSNLKSSAFENAVNNAAPLHKVIDPAAANPYIEQVAKNWGEWQPGLVDHAAQRATVLASTLGQ